MKTVIRRWALCLTSSRDEFVEIGLSNRDDDDVP